MKGLPMRFERNDKGKIGKRIRREENPDRLLATLFRRREERGSRVHERWSRPMRTNILEMEILIRLRK